MMHKILLCVIGLSALAKCRTAAVETSSVAWMDVIEAEKGEMSSIILVNYSLHCTHCKEELVRPLRIEVVVVIVQVSPPSVIMREY